MDSVHRQACQLRGLGYSYREIADHLRRPLSTVHGWVSGVVLSPSAHLRLKNRRKERSLYGSSILSQKRLQRSALAFQLAQKTYKTLQFDPEMLKIVAALIYWCEGAKRDKDSILFINSDPELIKTFIELLRACFSLDETKFRALIHIHSYHHYPSILHYWSRITRIPKVQFLKPFEKKEGGLVKREGYKGCISIRYYDVALARELRALAQLFLKEHGRVR